jgi:hypothetical protein
MVEPFGESETERERFTYSLFLVLCNRLTTMSVAIIGCLVCYPAKSARLCINLFDLTHFLF